MIPYGRQWIEDDDIQAVVDVLRSDWLTTGPAVEAFERAVAEFCGVQHAVAVCNGTAALHASMHALGIGPGDEVIVPAMTFAATANAVVFQGGTPVFADVEHDTLLIDAADAERKITPRTRALVAVDYAGQPCDYARLHEICRKHKLSLVADACHSLGGKYRDQPVGALADITVFSFHPVKHITTGEGGMAVTNDVELGARMRRFRNHGIATDHRQRAERGTWHYEMVDLGFNYRLTDLQSALGRIQLSKLPAWLERRRAIARRYDQAFGGKGVIAPLQTRADRLHAYHLYVVRLGCDRAKAHARLRASGIGANVHYIPVHLHPFYRERFQTGPGQCPVAENAYEHILSLPLFPKMSDRDVEEVIEAVCSSCVAERVA